MPMPAHPKIYHIVHADRLPSIVSDGWLWSDSNMAAQTGKGTTIGMNKIKRRRLEELKLASHPDLYVGQCVPFYFCPRSIMLYLLCRGNHPDLSYRGGQEPIIHLEADLNATVAWAQANHLRWAFTLSNAGALYFEDRNDLEQLGEIDWTAVHATEWQAHKEGKQAELLVERQFPWSLVTRVGVQSTKTRTAVLAGLQHSAHRPPVECIPDWYY